MYTHIKHTAKVFLFTFLFAGNLYAAADSFFKNIEISGAGGVSWLNTKDTELDISHVETDTNRVDSTSVDGAWRVGIGYYFGIDRLLLELNVYGTSSTVKGDVWQYKLAQFNNYNFEAPLSSTRLMLDFKPKLITWNKLTPYLILGTGVAWNTASYKETANAGIDPSGTRSLSEKTKAQLAWDLGLGTSYGLTDQLSITAEYVYAFLGEATPEENVTIVDSPDFSYQVQTLLFGLSLRF